MTRRLACIGTAALAALAASCAPERPNVVLVSIDSLRPDHLGAYGYARETSPALDRISRQGLLASAAHSSTSWTLPAHAALFTSLPDSVHGCIDDSRWLDESRETLVEVLKADGYATAGFFSGPYLHAGFGFAQGFDSYTDCTSYALRSLEVASGRSKEDLIELSHDDVTNGTVGDAVARWLRGSHGSPFLLFVHAWDVHADYRPPAPYASAFDDGYRGPVDGRGVVELARRRPGTTDADVAHLVTLYDAEILWTDALLARIDAELRRAGAREDTILAIVSDHGEAFYERGRQGHRHTLHAEETAILMGMRAPGRVAPGSLDTRPAGIVDLAPTILELAGAPPMTGAMGRSLLSRQGEAHLPVISELHVGARELAIRRPDVTLLVDQATREVRAFDPDLDPGESRELSPSARNAFMTVVAAASGKLRWAAGKQSPPGERPPLPDATEEQLRSLGYIP